MTEQSGLDGYPQMAQQLSFIDTLNISREAPAGVNSSANVRPFSLQLLKWVGNKQRFAHEIISFFPRHFGTYFEPFLGSGGVLATLAPQRALASDVFPHLVEIFTTLHDSPTTLIEWYRERWEQIQSGEKKSVYEAIKAAYNANPNPADLLFISRACYGGVVRFRKDGYLSTPCGVHDPIHPDSFAERVNEWNRRTQNTTFACLGFEEAIRMAQPGDLIYCDPPYSHSQAILYGAQAFNLERLLALIGECKHKGIYVVLSIDGTKKSGQRLCDLPIPDGLFEREVYVNVGRSMLKRFQMEGQTLEGEVVKDRLLLNY